jgi:hypothetical protein
MKKLGFVFVPSSIYKIVKKLKGILKSVQGQKKARGHWACHPWVRLSGWVLGKNLNEWFLLFQLYSDFIAIMIFLLLI